MCNHDPEYQRQNEAAGGSGCPPCLREEQQKDALAQLFAHLTKDERSHDQQRIDELANAERAMKDVPKGWPVNPAAQLWGDFEWELHSFTDTTDE
jgi:hypothetical protein